jgi:hypothetical protein
LSGLVDEDFSVAEITNELMYEVLKKLQADMAEVKAEVRENTAAINASRIHVVAMHQDVQNIYSILTRHEQRLERIERRLELVEPA